MPKGKHVQQDMSLLEWMPVELVGLQLGPRAAVWHRTRVSAHVRRQHAVWTDAGRVSVAQDIQLLYAREDVLGARKMYCEPGRRPPRVRDDVRTDDPCARRDVVGLVAVGSRIRVHEEFEGAVDGRRETVAYDPRTLEPQDVHRYGHVRVERDVVRPLADDRKNRVESPKSTKVGGEGRAADATQHATHTRRRDQPAAREEEKNKGERGEERRRRGDV